MARRGCLLLLGVVTVIAGLAGCGGGSPAAPSTPSDGRTIAITSAGVSPSSITVPPGTRVLFVNNDSRSHEMFSDPHPEHTDCPEINTVGLLSPGQSRETSNLNTVRSCGYHDHADPFNTRWHGTITIQ
jgi:plastocyanin